MKESSPALRSHLDSRFLGSDNILGSFSSLPVNLNKLVSAIPHLNKIKLDPSLFIHGIKTYFYGAN
jgi:hypothetical protein